MTFKSSQQYTTLIQMGTAESYLLGKTVVSIACSEPIRNLPVNFYLSKLTIDKLVGAGDMLRSI